MKRILAVPAAAAAATVMLLPSMAFGSVTATGAPGGTDPSFTQGIRICSSGFPEQGTGQFAIEGTREGFDSSYPDYFLTPVLNKTGDAVDAATPEDEATNLAAICYDVKLNPGEYRITPGKYLSARCLLDTYVQDTTTFAGPAETDFSDTRCQAFVHHYHTGHPGTPDNNGDGNTGDSSTLEVPEVVVTVKAHEITSISAHVVPSNYPECTQSGTSGPERICQPSPVAP